MATSRFLKTYATTGLLPLWTLLATVLVVVWSLLALSIHKGYRDAQDGARQMLEHQVKFAESNLSRQLQITSYALDMVRRASWLQTTATFNQSEANAELKNLVSLMPGVRTLLVVNADGKVLASNRTELLEKSMYGSERYLAISTNPHPDLLYLSPPFLTPLSNWAISASKMLVKGNNEFNGYVLAVMDPSYFGSMMQSILYTEDTRATLLHSDGKVVMRQPDPESLEGQDLSARPGSLFYLFKQTGKDRAIVDGTSAVTGKSLLIMFTTIRPEFSATNKALVIGISRERDKILEPWRRQTMERVSIALILTVLAIFFVYDRRQRHRSDTSAQ